MGFQFYSPFLAFTLSLLAFMQNTSLNILPSGGFSAEVHALAQSLGYHQVNFFDDVPNSFSSSMDELPKSGNIALAIGSSNERARLVNRIKGNYIFPNLVHPSVIFLEPASLKMGKGCLIAAGSILTTNVHIGDFVLINLQCSIGHDCILEDFVSLMPGARLSGGVHLEEGVYLGTNAVVLPNVRIGKNAVVGAGAVVTQDVAPNKTVVGIPAKAKS